MKNRLIGIVGGMGHLAGLDLAAKVVQVWAEQSSESAAYLLISDGNIPDRTAALLWNGADFVPAVVDELKRLHRAGADLAAIACNTAHARIDVIRQQSPIPVLDMIELTCAHIAATVPRRLPIGVLATRATIELDLYGAKLAAAGYTVVHADSATTELAHCGILEVKRHGAEAGTRSLARARSRLIDAGAKVIIMGCTEIPLAFGPGVTTTHIDTRPLTLIDPTLILAKALVAAAITNPNRS